MFVGLCRQLSVSPSYLLIDSLDDGNSDDITKLLKTATPSQIKLIHRMVESALSMLDEGE